MFGERSRISLGPRHCGSSAASCITQTVVRTQWTWSTRCRTSWPGIWIRCRSGSVISRHPADDDHLEAAACLRFQRPLGTPLPRQLSLTMVPRRAEAPHLRRAGASEAAPALSVLQALLIAEVRDIATKAATRALGQAIVVAAALQAARRRPRGRPPSRPPRTTCQTTSAAATRNTTPLPSSPALAARALAVQQAACTEAVRLETSVMEGRRPQRP